MATRHISNQNNGDVNISTIQFYWFGWSWRSFYVKFHTKPSLTKTNMFVNSLYVTLFHTFGNIQTDLRFNKKLFSMP